MAREWTPHVKPMPDYAAIESAAAQAATDQKAAQRVPQPAVQSGPNVGRKAKSRHTVIKT